MKKILKAIMTTATVAAMLLPVLFSGAALTQETMAADEGVRSADSREEAVYANLTTAGTVKDIYIVTTLHNSTAGIIAEHGNFTAIKNLTDTSALELADNYVAISAPAGDFYYQGDLKSTALPWQFNISYTLDGVVISPDDLAGKTGHVGITVATGRDSSLDAVFFDNYTLQISLTLDTAKCRNIIAPGATVVSAGSNKMVNFTVMPGKAGDFSIETDATDFEMAGIELTGIPMSIQLDPPDTGDMLSDLTELTDAIAELDNGIAKLSDGALELKSGAFDLKGGSLAFASGVKQLDDNAAQLVSGSSQIKKGLTDIATSMTAPPEGQQDLSSIQQLPDGLLQLAGGVDGLSAGLSELQESFDAAYNALKAAITEIPDVVIPENELNSLYQSNPDKTDILDTLTGYYATGRQAKQTFSAVSPAFEAVGPTLDQVIASAGQISGSLSATAGQIQTALNSDDMFSQLGQLTAGLQSLSENYSAFHEGLAAFADGVSDLKTNYSGLDNGVAGLADGVSALYDGIDKTADGTSELSDAVGNLPEKTDEEISKLMDDYDKSDIAPVSFADTSNDNTVSVQFVMKTEKIEKPPVPAPAPEPKQTESLWTKFINLFN